MDKQDELVRRTRGEPGRTRRIWQADRQCVIWLYHSPCFLRGIHYDAAPALAPSTAQTAVGLYWYWQGWPKARREGADGWCPSTPTGITQRRVGYRGQERICVSALSKCHVSRESMFKEGEKEWFIFYAINTHAYFRFYVAFLITSSKQIGRHFWLSVNMTINILLKPKKKSSLMIYSRLYLHQKPPANIWPGRQLCPWRAELQKQTRRGLVLLYIYWFIIYIFWPKTSLASL